MSVFVVATVALRFATAIGLWLLRLQHVLFSCVRVGSETDFDRGVQAALQRHVETQLQNSCTLANSPYSPSDEVLVSSPKPLNPPNP